MEVVDTDAQDKSNELGISGPPSAMMLVQPKESWPELLREAAFSPKIAAACALFLTMHCVSGSPSFNGGVSDFGSVASKSSVDWGCGTLQARAPVQVRARAQLYRFEL
jgi:hypothetical protein